MNEEVLIQVKHNWYCAGIVVRNGVVVAAAPILRKRVLGARWLYARNLLVSSGAVLEVVNETCPTTSK